MDTEMVFVFDEWSEDADVLEAADDLCDEHGFKVVAKGSWFIPEFVHSCGERIQGWLADGRIIHCAPYEGPWARVCVLSDLGFKQGMHPIDFLKGG